MDATYRDTEGELVVRYPSPQAIVTEASGVASKAMVLLYIREFHAFLDKATLKFDVFHDWGKVTSVHSDARTTFMRWGQERRDRNKRACRGVHVLVESTIIYLALEAGSAFARSYSHTYRLRHSFERERDRLVRSPSTDLIARV